MPGFGDLTGGGDGSSGGGISPRQRLALLVSALTLLAAMVVVLVLSPRQPPARPPRDLLGYGDAGALAVLRAQGALEVWRRITRSRFVAVARSRGLVSRVEGLLRRAHPYLPPGLAGLAYLAPRLFDLDVAVFLYPAGSGTELAAVAQGKLPLKLDLPTERTEIYRGHELGAYVPKRGQEVHLTWRGRSVLVASTRARLKKLVDRHLGTGARSLMQDPLFQRALGALPAGDRALAYLNLAQGLARPPWASLRTPALRRWLGEPAALAGSVDLRPDGARFTAVLLQQTPPDWVARMRGWLGTPGRLRAERVVPRGALAVGAIRLSPARLRERLREPAPIWLAPLLDRVRRALPPPHLANLLGELDGEVALGLAPGTPAPVPFWAVRTRRATPGLFRVLADYVPGPTGSALRAVSSLREESVGRKAHLLLRDLPRPGGLAVGTGPGWLFGGSETEARTMGAALEGKRWKTSALAREVFIPAAHLLLWLDLRRLWAGLRSAAAGKPRLAALVARLGSLPNGFLSAGAALRLYPRRVVVRAFLRMQDLP